MRIGNFVIFEKRGSLENPRTNLSNPAAWLVDLFGGAASAAGINVAPESVLKIPAGVRSVGLISDTIASLPLQVFRTTIDGREVMRSSPLFTMLHSRPNPGLTSFRWRRLVMKHLLLHNRHFTRISRNQAGRPTGLFPLKPADVKVERINGSVRYKVKLAKGGTETLVAEEVLHFTGLDDDDGLDGLPMIGNLEDAIGLTIALETYGASFFANGARPGLVLEYPVGRNLSDAAIARLKQSIETSHSTVGDSHKVLVTEDGVKVTKVSIDPEQAQFTETRELQRKEIANIFNVPLFFLGDSDPAKANSEQQALFFVKHTIRPWLVMLEQEMNLKLLTVGQARSQNIEHNVDGILRGDFKARMEGYASGIQNSVLTPNEARRRENLPDMDQGNQLVIQQNMSPLGTFSQPDQPDLFEDEDDENQGS